MNPTIKEIVAKYLKESKFDGLFNPDGECACKNDDLFPCDEFTGNCEAGYKTKCNCEDEDGCFWMGSGCDWHVSRERDKPKPDGLE